MAQHSKQHSARSSYEAATALAQAKRTTPLGSRACVVFACFFALFFVVPTQAHAQIPDIVDLSAQYIPGTELDDPPGLEAQVSSYDFTLNVPVVLGERTFLIPGLNYHVDSISFENTPDEFVDLRMFQSVSLPVLFVQILPRNWSLAARVAPGIAGDFETIDSRMLTFSGVLSLTKGVSERLVVGFGGIASYAFGVLLPLPSFYMDWTPNDWLRFETYIPAFAHLDFLIGDRIEIGPRIDIAGNDYAVRDERVAQSPACNDPTSNANCLDHVAYSVATTGVQLGVRIAGTLWTTFYGGRTIYRRLEMRNRDGDTLDGGLETLPSDWFIRANLVFRIPMPSDEEVEPVE